ncbi:MAG: LamG-like jellyroll fold domain-containing protein [Pseudomonadota bacterium]
MPYIKVIDGVMQEFNREHRNTGRVASIGLNAYSYLERCHWGVPVPGAALPADSPESPAYPEDFQFLQANGFQYVQVMTSPFAGKGGAYSWSGVIGDPTFKTDSNTVLSLNIKPGYWEAVTALLDCAVRHDIGVIACPFWNVQAIPVLVGETNVALADPNSKTRNYMRAFTVAFTQRFAEHVGVAAWMANQEILNVNHNKEKIVYLEICNASDILRETAGLIRANDKLGRMISSGNAGIPHYAPRLTSLDDYLATVLPALNPPPIDCLCQNLFLDNEFVSSGQLNGDLRADFASMSLAYLKTVRQFASDMKMPYYVGSFGLSEVQEGLISKDEAEQQTNLRALLRNMAAAGIQLASHWAWNCKPTMHYVRRTDEVEGNEGWNVQVGVVEKDKVRGPVFVALKEAQASLASTVPDKPVRRGHRPFHNKVLSFTITEQAGQMIEIPFNDNFPKGAFSLSFSIRQSAYPSSLDLPLIQCRNGNGEGWAIRQKANASYLTVATKAGEVNNHGQGLGPYTDGKDRWVRCTYTVSAAGSISVYVDDFLMYQVEPSRTSELVNKRGASIRIGRNATGLAEGSWQMSDLILYDGVLTPAEVFAYGVGGEPPGGSKVVGHWKLDEDKFLDSSGNGNNANSIGRAKPSIVAVDAPPEPAPGAHAGAGALCAAPATS